MILSITHAIIFISYVLFIVIRYKVPASISDSYYLLKGSTNIIFTFWCWVLGFSLFFHGVPLLFLCGASLCFVGAAAAFREGLTKTVHYTSATICIVSGILNALLTGHYYIPATFAVATLIVSVVNMRNKVFWIESGVFVVIMLSLPND